MTAEMVERVARAIGEALFGYYEPLEDGDSSSSAQARLAARTAITAMREPTEGMVEASNREWDGRMSHRSSGAWLAMIDAALADNTP